MSAEEVKNEKEEVKENENVANETNQEEKATEETQEEPKEETEKEEEEAKVEEKPCEEVKDEKTLLQEQLAAINDKYIRLSAEFDNYRKRTLKEKMELTKSAGRDIFLSILPVVDNFERGLKSLEDTKDSDAIKEGVELIYNNFKEFLKQRGVKEIEAINTVFDTDIHEAVTQIPAPNKDLKGKVVDVIEKGYCLNEKVIRFAKVVVGQ